MVALLIVPFAFLVLLAATVVLGGSVGAAELTASAVTVGIATGVVGGMAAHMALRAATRLSL